MRNPVHAVEELLNNPMFREGMNFVPEKAYTDPSQQSRVFDKMWTGNAWWKVQVRIANYIL